VPLFALFAREGFPIWRATKPNNAKGGTILADARGAYRVANNAKGGTILGAN